MKTSSDNKKIGALMDQGYKVVVSNLKGQTFRERYDVYQNVGFDQLKRVLVDSEGNTSWWKDKPETGQTSNN